MADPQNNYNSYSGYDDYVSLSFGSYSQPSQKVSIPDAQRSKMTDFRFP